AALARAFDRKLDAVKWAGMLTGDIGRLAELARDGRLDDASLALFHPIKFMLASPAEDADEIVKRLGVPVWVEDKYDGIRAQLHEPLEDRRRALVALRLPLADDGGVFALSHLVSVSSVDALEDAFLGARERRNEGLMVKDPRSIYSPGRRGLGWLKMKKALATIDCVVVGVEVGHGKRHGVLSDY